MSFTANSDDDGHAGLADVLDHSVVEFDSSDDNVDSGISTGRVDVISITSLHRPSVAVEGLGQDAPDVETLSKTSKRSGKSQTSRTSKASKRSSSSSRSKNKHSSRASRSSRSSNTKVNRLALQQVEALITEAEETAREKQAAVQHLKAAAAEMREALDADSNSEEEGPLLRRADLRGLGVNASRVSARDNDPSDDSLDESEDDDPTLLDDETKL